jgi:RNA recognition motif-containing protein
LKKEFEEFGKIASCEIPKNYKGLSKGFGLIKFESEEAASDAMKKMNGEKLDGREIFVKFDEM